jgi:hypothetical protein
MKSLQDFVNGLGHVRFSEMTMFDHSSATVAHATSPIMHLPAIFDSPLHKEEMRG